ncbi:NAD-dependent epimerase/dehydratase family protein [Microbacteriaceae bacterium VKM Ac-2854]|nr:NAD-dependent epimerase/dehydratase family protein [Microbacteriaceae bacterium VKM Ac-2854]
MRIVVIGATGNLGTALLTRLAGEGHEVVGVARRVPDTRAAPYGSASWRSVDIAATDAPARLAPVFEGADAVVHLAWALQPNHNEHTLRRVNVTGTAAVLSAVAAAGVPHLVVASSVGAYSIGPKNARVDESWPTGGIATSHYSRHKAMNERALDRFEAAHPGVTVARIRPGLVFQENAATEIAGLFLGRHIPTRWLGSVRIPVVPLSTRIVSQAVHARDVAEAFTLALEQRASGAFNIAAEPVLGPVEVAAAVGGRPVPFRFDVLRSVVWLSWKLRLQATDPGWLDIAAGVPIMSTERARRELGWAPTVSATDALAEIVRGLARRSRVPESDPLHG